MTKVATLLLFGLAGFVMITGFIFISALSGALIRDNTPERDTGKLQGVRMIFGVLIPMLVGPAIGNAINGALGNPLENGGADAMTTLHVPVKEIFLAAALISLLIYAVIPLVDKAAKSKQK
jgi:MFS family permease